LHRKSQLKKKGEKKHLSGFNGVRTKARTLPRRGWGEHGNDPPGNPLKGNHRRADKSCSEEKNTTDPESQGRLKVSPEVPPRRATDSRTAAAKEKKKREKSGNLSTPKVQHVKAEDSKIHVNQSKRQVPQRPKKTEEKRRTIALVNATVWDEGKAAGNLFGKKKKKPREFMSMWAQEK